MFYEIEIAGLKRQLPLCPLNENLYLGAFVIFGDVELTVACARELNRMAPDYDILITAESKGIPLAYEMARQAGSNKYLIARKAPKLYMRDVFTTTVRSITTAKEQTLCLDGEDAAFIRGKRVLVVDDVISTGESLRALARLIEEAGGIVAGRMAVLAEGEAKNRTDIRFLQWLPLFDRDGNPIPA